MNFATFIIAAIIVVAFVFAVKYSTKHGTCEDCGGGHCGGTCSHKIPFDKIRAELKAEKADIQC